MRASSFTSILLFGVSTLALISPAAAQTAPEATAQAINTNQGEDDFGTIIVTATKRASTVQDVPFSINAQTQEDIQRANASTIEDISRNVAGLAVQNLGPVDRLSGGFRCGLGGGGHCQRQSGNAEQQECSE